MHNLKILPYKMGSESAKELATVLNVMRVRPDGDYVPKIGHICINWGLGREPVWAQRAIARGVKILNKTASVEVAGNKLHALQKLQSSGIAVPEFTTDINVANRWLQSYETVVERHELRGNSGEGIRIVNLDDEDMPSTVQRAPLYTKFIPKTAEFRVHVFRGEVIDYIEKKRIAADRRPENFNKYVSSVHQGWVFARTGIMENTAVKEIAIKAVNCLGLDFGAVDVIYYEGRPYVLEVNTAPGLAGTTLVKYANAFRRYMGVANLSTDVVNQIMGQSGETAPTTPAANRALDGWLNFGRQTVATPGPVRSDAPVGQQNRHAMDQEVVLKLDRATALKLKALLASIN